MGHGLNARPAQEVTVGSAMIQQRTASRHVDSHGGYRFA